MSSLESSSAVAVLRSSKHILAEPVHASNLVTSQNHSSIKEHGIVPSTLSNAYQPSDDVRTVNPSVPAPPQAASVVPSPPSPGPSVPEVRRKDDKAPIKTSKPLDPPPRRSPFTHVHVPCTESSTRLHDFPCMTSSCHRSLSCSPRRYCVQHSHSHGQDCDSLSYSHSHDRATG